MRQACSIPHPWLWHGSTNPWHTPCLAAARLQVGPLSRRQVKLLDLLSRLYAQKGRCENGGGKRRGCGHDERLGAGGRRGGFRASACLHVLRFIDQLLGLFEPMFVLPLPLPTPSLLQNHSNGGSPML